MVAEDYILGIDLGTKKVAAVFGPSREGHLTLCGLGLAPSDGVRRGEIIDLERASTAIKLALSNLRPVGKEALANSTGLSETALPKLPSRAWVGITGDHIHCFNPYASIAITRPGRPIAPRDVEEVMRAAVNSISLPSGHEVIHVIARTFAIHLREKENASPLKSASPGAVAKPATSKAQTASLPLTSETFRNSITNPVGMPASKLEVQAHVISASTAALGHLEHCLDEAGLAIEGVVLEPLASADAVLSEAERELGVALLDIGAGTTDIAIFIDGAICHTGSIALGGNHITRDLALGLEIAPEEAENLKIASGCALLDSIETEEKVSIRPLSLETTRQIPRRLVAEVIQPRATEILSFAKEQMLRSGFFHRLSVGVVITGGGSQLQELVPLAKQVLGLPVRLGRPFPKAPKSFKDPALATGLGLLLYGCHEQVNAPPVTWPPNKHNLISRVMAWWKHLLGT